MLTSLGGGGGGVGSAGSLNADSCSQGRGQNLPKS